MTNIEELILKRDVSILEHKAWKDSMDLMYEYKKNQRSDNEELIDTLENFDKMKISKEDINNMFQKCEDHKKKKLDLMKKIQPAKKQ